MSFWSILRANKRYVEQEQAEAKHAALVADAMILSMACVAEADGTIADTEVAKMSQVYARVTGNQTHPDHVQSVIDAALAAEDNIEVLLGEITPELEHTDKANIIHAGVLIAKADGEFDISEQSEVWRLGQALGVSADALRDIIERTDLS